MRRDSVVVFVGGGWGWGAVLLDSHGEFLVRCCHFFPSPHDAEVAELLASQRALHLARELDVQGIILETDAQVVVSMLLNEQKYFMLMGSWLRK